MGSGCVRAGLLFYSLIAFLLEASLLTQPEHMSFHR